MAQATRTSATTARLSDDPLENATDWFSMNRKPILTLLAVVAGVAVLILGYRWWDSSKRADASTALFQAQLPLGQGNAKDAEPALERVVNRYGGTAAGQQAALVLAQVRYENGKHAEGIKGLEAALGSANDDFRPEFEQMIAMGYEAQGKREQAADHYGKAADAAKFDAEKAQYQASQARHLQAAGKTAEARTIWESLSQREDLPVYQEARVRLGEILGGSK